MTISRKFLLVCAAACALCAAAMVLRGPAAGAGDSALREGAPKDDGAEAPAIDPQGPNAACYVCHMTFVREELSKVHLAAKVDCAKCHGTSAKHANDEDVGATKPDIVFKKHEVDAMCRKCHETHDAPARKVVARFVERKLADDKFVCTDCHGTHKIEHAAEPAASGGR